MLRGQLKGSELTPAVRGRVAFRVAVQVNPVPEHLPQFPGRRPVPLVGRRTEAYLEEVSQAPRSCGLTALEAFAHLVVASVFKTAGGFEQSSLWVRFPYASASM